MSLLGLSGDSRMPTRAAPHTPTTASTTSSSQPRAVGDAAAVGVGSLVGAVAQELVEQIAVRAVHLDAVEARALGVRARPSR